MLQETFKDMFFLKKKTRLLNFITGIQSCVSIHKHELTRLLPGAQDSHNQPNVISPADLKCSHQPPNAILVIMLLTTQHLSAAQVRPFQACQNMQPRIAKNTQHKTIN